MRRDWQQNAAPEPQNRRSQANTLHVVPMFFCNFWRKPKKAVTLEEIMEAAAKQLRELDEKDSRQQNRSEVLEGAVSDDTLSSHSSPVSTGVYDYEPMRKVPFMSLEISLEETERSSDEEEDKPEVDEHSFVCRREVSQNCRGSQGGLSWSETDSNVEFGNAKSCERIPQDSCLLDLLSSRKELGASPVVVDLVARVSECTPVSETTSGGSPAHATRQPIHLHRSPIPTEVYCLVEEELTASLDHEILDPTEKLIFGRIPSHTYLQGVSDQMNRYLVALDDGDVDHLGYETLRFIQCHPICCQIKYKAPKFGQFCYPLHIFAAAGWLEGCKACYAAFPEAVGQEEDSKIGLPLHAACFYGASFDVVNFLLCTYPEAARVTNFHHQTPLHQACRSKDVNLEIVLILIQQYETAPQLKDQLGYTPLHLAIRSGAPVEILTALLDSSPTAIRTVTLDWYRPLHLAALCGAPLEIIEWLVKKDPAAIRATGEDFSTVLHYAVAGGCSAEVVKLFLELYRPAVNLTNDDDETPFDVALRMDTQLEVLELVCPPAYGEGR